MRNLFKTLLPLFAFVACIVAGSVSAGMVSVNPATYSGMDRTDLEPLTPFYVSPRAAGNTWQDTVGGATTTSAASDIYYADCDGGSNLAYTHISVGVSTSTVTAPSAPAFTINLRKQAKDGVSWATASVTDTSGSYVSPVLEDSTFLGLQFGAGNYKWASVHGFDGLFLGEYSGKPGHWRIIVSKVAGTVGVVPYKLTVACYKYNTVFRQGKWPEFMVSGGSLVTQVQDR
jgi:hypothetical protein